MGKASRDKGIRGETEALKLLGDELGQLLYRNLTQTRHGGADCTLVKGFAIEIKRQERLNRKAWWAQARAQAAEQGLEPMLLYRQNGEPWRAYIHTQDGNYFEGSLIEAAGAIREKWAILYGDYAAAPGAEPEGLQA